MTFEQDAVLHQLVDMRRNLFRVVKPHVVVPEICGIRSTGAAVRPAQLESAKHTRLWYVGGATRGECCKRTIDEHHEEVWRRRTGTGKSGRQKQGASQQQNEAHPSPPARIEGRPPPAHTRRSVYSGFHI